MPAPPRPRRPGPRGAHGAGVAIAGLVAGLLVLRCGTTKFVLEQADAGPGLDAALDGHVDGSEAGCSVVALPPCEGGACNAFVEVAAGEAFACALRADGSVWCWGANDSAQLGHAPNMTADTMCNKSVVCNPTPSRVMGGAVHITAGANFGCAVTTAGQVSCWGANSVGQLGHNAMDYGTDTPSSCPSTGSCNATAEPVLTSSPMNPASKNLSADGVVAGGAFACATSCGAVSCWGDDHNEQLGAAVRDDAGTPINPYPVEVPIVGPAAQVSAFGGEGASACALLGSGDIWCWGSNSEGDLASPDASVCRHDGGNPTCGPVLLRSLDGGAFGPSTQVTVGGTGYGQNGVACALQGGRPWCWGSNADGVFDDSLPAGTVTDNPQLATYLEQVAKQAATNVVLIRAGGISGSALDEAGAVWGWGTNYAGQLGPANPNKLVTTPQQIPTPKPAVLLALGGGQNSFTVALLTDGTVWTWGANDSAQLGHVQGHDNDGECGNNNLICNPVATQVRFPSQ